MSSKSPESYFFRLGVHERFPRFQRTMGERSTILRVKWFRWDLMK